MAAALVLTVLQDRSDALGHLAALAVALPGDDRDAEVIIATVGATGAAVLASPDAKVFAPPDLARRRYPLACSPTSDAVWACGDGGELAVSRDRGATWSRLDTGVRVALRALARASDGAVWAVGVRGSRHASAATRTRRCARRARHDRGADRGLRGGRRRRRARCGDGIVRRWRGGDLAAVATGAPAALTAMAVTRRSWIVIGEGGFVGRSPDGTWFSRAAGSRGGTWRRSRH